MERQRLQTQTFHQNTLILISAYTTAPLNPGLCLVRGFSLQRALKQKSSLWMSESPWAQYFTCSMHASMFSMFSVLSVFFMFYVFSVFSECPSGDRWCQSGVIYNAVTRVMWPEEADCYQRWTSSKFWVLSGREINKKPHSLLDSAVNLEVKVIILWLSHLCATPTHDLLLFP